MPNAITYTIGADAQPFAREIRQMENLAQMSARSISGQMAMGAHEGYAGVVRESLVLGREIASGRGGPRVIGSATILLGYLSRLVSGANHAGEAATAASQAYQLMSLRMSQAAAQSLAVAAAKEEEFMATSGATEADLEAALAARSQAVAQEAAAVAYNNKAAAAARAAEIEMAEAAASKAGVGGILVGPLVAAVAIVATLGAAMYGVYRWTKATADALSGFKDQPFHPEYIAAHLQAVNAAAEAWKKIQLEAEKAVDTYNSAAKAAERIANLSQEQYDHERKMNELAKQRDLALAGNDPGRRRQIERQYAEADIAALHRRTQELNAQRVDEINSSEDESSRKKAQADAIRVSNRDHDEEDIRHKKQLADEGQKYLDELAAAGESSPEDQHKVLRHFNNLFNITGAILGGTGVTDEDYTNEARAAQNEARRRISNYRESVDRTAANDELRQRRERLVEEASHAHAHAEELAAGGADYRARLAQEEANRRAEINAELAASEAQSRHGGGRNHSEVNSAQRIGFAYVGEGVRDQVRLLTQIERNTRRSNVPDSHSRGGTSHSHGRPHFGP